MVVPSASYSITMRVHLQAGDHRALGRATTAVGEAGGAVTAVDFVEPDGGNPVVDITVNANDSDHADRIEEAVGAAEGVRVHRTSDRTFLLHLGGKIEVTPRVPLKTRDDLSMAYTPGVARVSQALAQRPEDARALTIKGNTVAIVTDGSAVLGLGDIGPVGALPVMEGKAVLFKRFAGVDAWPVCLATNDPDEIVATVQAMAPVFGGINLEDIAAPDCFDIEARLRESLDIPVFHDDQHGTAIVTLAALLNALRVVSKRMHDIRVAMAGAGAAGVAVAKLLLAEGVGEIICSDRSGILHPGREGLNVSKRWMADNTNSEGATGSLVDSLSGADVFIGVSGPDLFDPSELSAMADDAIVFAMANPDPEVDPHAAAEHAAVVATGRSDYPNQINNVLAFPGVFRGALDAYAAAITEPMKAAAAHAIANVVGDALHPTYIVPSVFNAEVAPAVADAVRTVWNSHT
ncbi:MAG: NAD-dependent malic enzyme [Actinobacteria bacterium]|nr:NAD-dependent malic enzyme [Actinomycetota bacterium]